MREQCTALGENRMPLDADLVENGAVTSPRLIEFASCTHGMEQHEVFAERRVHYVSLINEGEVRVTVPRTLHSGHREQRCSSFTQE